MAPKPFLVGQEELRLSEDRLVIIDISNIDGD